MTSAPTPSPSCDESPSVWGWTMSMFSALVETFDGLLSKLPEDALLSFSGLRPQRSDTSYFFIFDDRDER